MNTKRGFTLIELLVVIAIIGILSAVVLASLNTARSKGQDAAIQSDLTTIQTQAEIYYGGTGNNSYGANGTTCAVGVFSDPTIIKAVAAMTTAAGNVAPTCNTSGGTVAASTAYSIWSGLVAAPTKAWCVDSTGSSKSVTKPTGVITVCP